MKTVSVVGQDVSSEVIDEAAGILDQGGLICLPCVRSYRIISDLTNPKAVTRLMQSKSRTAKKPSLVFVANRGMLDEVVVEMSPLAERLGREFWPGPLTILFAAHPSLPRKVTRQLGTGDGRIGVRIPTNQLVRRIVETLGRPVLASSANKQKKSGAASPAQVRKNFYHRVGLFLDAGDLPPGPASTVVDLDGGTPVVVRPGAIPSEELAELAERRAHAS